MRIIIRDGEFVPDRDIEPNGVDLWEGGDDELPAAILANMSREFEPGTWYKLREFALLVEAMEPVGTAEEVLSTVVAVQSGVIEPWQADIGIGQSRAALMICRSVVEHAERLNSRGETWIRVD